MIFKIENKGSKYPNADQTPKITFMDQRIWKGGPKDDTQLDDWDAHSVELLEPLVSDDPLGKINSKFVKSLLQPASSMTIVPMFVQLDEALVPEKDLAYDEEVQRQCRQKEADEAEMQKKKV